LGDDFKHILQAARLPAEVCKVGVEFVEKRPAGVAATWPQFDEDVPWIPALVFVSSAHPTFEPKKLPFVATQRQAPIQSSSKISSKVGSERLGRSLITQVHTWPTADAVQQLIKVKSIGLYIEPWI
jgi:hypothetical protein